MLNKIICTTKGHSPANAILETEEKIYSDYCTRCGQGFFPLKNKTKALRGPAPPGTAPEKIEAYHEGANQRYKDKWTNIHQNNKQRQ